MAWGGGTNRSGITIEFYNNIVRLLMEKTEPNNIRTGFAIQVGGFSIKSPSGVVVLNQESTLHATET